MGEALWTRPPPLMATPPTALLPAFVDGVGVLLLLGRPAGGGMGCKIRFISKEGNKTKLTDSRTKKVIRKVGRALSQDSASGMILCWRAGGGLAYVNQSMPAAQAQHMLLTQKVGAISKGQTEIADARATTPHGSHSIMTH